MNQFRWKHFFISILTLLLAIGITACTGGSSPTPLPEPTVETAVPPTPATDLPTAVPTESSEESTNLEPIIETTDLSQSETGIVRLSVTGQLRDACTTLVDSEQTIDIATNTFQVRLITERDDEAVCAQVLTPFEEMITLQTAELPAGQYTVMVQEQQVATFTLADQPPASGTAQIMPESGPAGSTVQLVASDLPQNVQVELGAGLVQSEYDILTTAQTDANGRLVVDIQIPEYADTGDEWVIVVEGPSGTKTISNSFMVTESESTVTFSQATIYLIALEDEGQSGEEIGCGDSLVPVTVTFEPTVAPLTAALEALLSIEEPYYGQSGLYHSLHDSDLTVDGINIVNEQATIALSGELTLGGTCDTPRVEAQLGETALQYSTIESVQITLNGNPLNELLSATGP